MEPQQRLLDDVRGLGDAAEHPVGERERDGRSSSSSRSDRLCLREPRRQLGRAGRHARLALALALKAPRSSVIITTQASPANSRPMNRGTRIGFFAEGPSQRLDLLGDRGGLVVDDVVDTEAAVRDRGHRRLRRVGDVG